MYSPSNARIAVVTVSGVLGAIITECFGGWSTDITTLCLFMAIDYVLGLIVAGIFNKSNKTKSGALSSSAAFEGACRKGVILLLVLVAHRLDLLIGTKVVRSGAVIGFCCNELISMLENVSLMGVPMPSIFTKALDILKHKSEEEDDDGSDKGD